uniref:G_PROTEIN_RECEP_F1_2 domain-containing protein n=1 Tax=Panagrellus redivivus TaxID=6233 RepID=A0A7E4VV80_PANRE
MEVSIVNATAEFIHTYTDGGIYNVTEASIAFQNRTAIALHIVNETLVFHKKINISMSTLLLMKISNAAGYIYMLLAVLGVILNAGVLARLAHLAYSDYYRFKTGCGLPLAAMSAADLTSLSSIIVTVVLSAFIPHNFFPPWARSLQCKVTMFLIHAMTGFSTWCWLFISAQRYMAVYHPLWHISRWQLGYGSLLLMLLFLLLTNSWLLLSVVGISHTCGEMPLTTKMDLNRIIHGIEMFISYIVPAIITFGIDYASLSEDAVLAYDNTFAKHTPKITKPTTKQHVRRARSAVRKWLTITTIDLLLNMPDNLLRIASIISTGEQKNQSSKVYHLIALVARLLYFAQFCFNALYLSTLVYKRNVESSKSRKQRLRQERGICRNCGRNHDPGWRCHRSPAVRKHLQRRFSLELGFERQHIDANGLIESRSTHTCLNLPDLTRAPSLPLSVINAKNHH